MSVMRSKLSLSLGEASSTGQAFPFSTGLAEGTFCCPGRFEPSSSVWASDRGSVSILTAVGGPITARRHPLATQLLAPLSTTALRLRLATR